MPGGRGGLTGAVCLAPGLCIPLSHRPMAASSLALEARLKGGHGEALSDQGTLGKHRPCRDPGSAMSHKQQLPCEGHPDFVSSLNLGWRVNRAWEQCVQMCASLPSASPAQGRAGCWDVGVGLYNSRHVPECPTFRCLLSEKRLLLKFGATSQRSWEAPGVGILRLAP